MSTEKKFTTAIKAKDYDKALEILGELDQTIELNRCPFDLLFKQYKESADKEIIDFSEFLCSKNVYFDSKSFIDNLDLLNVFSKAFKTHLPKIVVKDIGSDVLERIKPLDGARLYKQKQDLYKLTDLMLLAGYAEQLSEFIVKNYKKWDLPEGFFSNSKQYNVFNNFFFLDRKLTNNEIESVCDVLHYTYSQEETILFLSETYISNCVKIVEQKILDTDNDSYRNRYELILSASFLDEDELDEIVLSVENSF